MGKCSDARAKLVLEESFDPLFLPESTPFLKLVANVGDSSDENAIRKMWTLAEERGADYVLVAPTESNLAGTVSSYWGFGVSTNQLVYARSITGVCFRVRPSRHGITTDETGLVLAIDDTARKSGILEGDTIMSIDGQPWRSIGRFPSAREVCLLGKLVGSSAQLVWIRAGTGRMSGEIALQANPPTHLGLADPMQYEPPPPPSEFTGWNN